MSSSISENKAYFIKALNEVIERKTQADMAGFEGDAKTSIRHKIIMKQIAKGKCFDAADKAAVIKKTVLIAVIVAMLALTSCALAIIYRQSIAGFIERVYEEYLLVSPADENGETAEKNPPKIGEKYEFTYIPEGYHLKSKTVYLFVSIHLYEDSAGNKLLLKQKAIDTSKFKLDINNGYSQAFEVEGITVYYREEYLNTYVFQKGGYVLQIHYEGEISQTELRKIIVGIQ